MFISRYKKQISVFMVLLATSFQVFAEGEAEVVSNLKAKFPKVVLIEQPRQVMDNLYEVIIEGKYAYTNKQAAFLLTGGEMIDTAKLVNVTSASFQERLTHAFSKLPLSKGFATVYGDGKAKVALFIDPDCPYCKEFEKNIEANKSRINATIYRFWFPLRIHPDSRNKINTILCSSNPNQAMFDWMNKGVMATPASGCDKSADVDFYNSLARSFRFDGTPTILFEDSSLANRGILTIDQFIAAINASNKSLGK